MIYDTVSNCTWLQDAMYAKTAGLDADGLVSRDWAQSFCNNLVYGGFDDWIMPRVFEGSYGSDFYNLLEWSLGNSRYSPPYLTNSGPFVNLTSASQRFWSRGTDGWSSQTWYYSLVEALKVDNGWGSNIAWPCRVGDVGTLPDDFDRSLKGGSFSGSLAGWDVVTSGGSASVHDYNGNSVAKLVTGSPVILKQRLDTPAEAFDLDYDYDFASWSGTLTVTLNGTVIDTLSGNGGRLYHRTRSVTNPALLGLSKAELAFKFDNYSSGTVLYLDAIAITPEPATLGLLLLGGLTIAASRRRR